MSKTKKVVEVKEVAVKKTKSMGMAALLRSEKTGEKLAGALRMFGEAELIRTDLTRMTIVNKCSKAGLKLRTFTNDEVDSNADLTKVRSIINKNISALKDSMTDKEADFNEDLQEAYEILLSFGKMTKKDKVPTDLTF